MYGYVPMRHAVATHGREITGTILVVSDGSALATAVASAFAARNKSSISTVLDELCGSFPLIAADVTILSGLQAKLDETSATHLVVFMCGEPSTSERPLGAAALHIEQFGEVLRRLGLIVSNAPNVVTWTIVTSLGGCAGMPLHPESDLATTLVYGFMRSFRREFPRVETRILDLPRADTVHDVHAVVLERLIGSPEGHAEWSVSGEGVTTTSLVQVWRDPTDIHGGDGELPLSPGDRVIATGGATGICAQILLDWCKDVPLDITLVGSTKFENTREVRELASRVDLSSWSADFVRLRSYQLDKVVNSGAQFSPREFEEAWAATARCVEISKTLELMEQAGSSARYEQVDVRDPYECARFVERTVAGGAVAAIVHAAGVERSRSLVTKAPEDWASTIDVKLGGFLNLTGLYSQDTKFSLLFGSIAGALGNEGQADYAAASESLFLVADYVAQKFPRCRMLAVAWPAWSSVGMAVDRARRAGLVAGGSEFMPLAEGLSWARAIVSGSTPFTHVVVDQRDRETRSITRSVVTRGAVLGLRYISVGGRLTERRYEYDWIRKPGSENPLTDHRVGGRIRLPFAWFVEAAIEAYACSRGVIDKFYEVSKARIDGGVRISENRVHRLSISVLDMQRGDALVRISSAPCSPTGIPVARSREVFTAVVSSTPHYTQGHEWKAVGDSAVDYTSSATILSDLDITYGPAFRGLGEARRSDDHVEILATPDKSWLSGSQGRMIGHVGLLDLAFQTLFFDGRMKFGLPIGIGRILISSELASSPSMLLRSGKVDKSSDYLIEGVSLDGSRLLEVQNIELRERVHREDRTW